MKKVLPFVITALTFATLTACGSKGGSTYKNGDTIFENRIIYDTSKDNYAVSIKLKSDKKVISVSCGRAKSSKKEFGVKNNILTLQGSFMSQIGSGEKEITVTFKDNSKEKIDALIATKVITTAEEFQAINDNLKGVYVLGNDIDLSSIQNFEPLGKFYEETSIKNDYFHGILDGNGYTVKNAKVFYCSSPTSSQDVYLGGSLFTEECHKSGNNIGLFQYIGSSGIVRNIVFDNIKVRGKTIVGVVAGNVSGVLENCIVTSSCSAAMGTHYYDNDCNIGGVAGIVSSTGVIKNVVSLTEDIILPNEFMDYSTDYIGKIGNGADHTTEQGNTDPSWKYWNVDRPLMDYSSGTAVSTNQKEIDSNGVQSNGKYAFAGKTWGSISDSFALKFTNNVLESTARDICFSQTHLEKNKPASGNDMGTLTNCAVLTDSELKSASTYASFDSEIWNITDGQYPTIKCPLINSYIAQ